MNLPDYLHLSLKKNLGFSFSAIIVPRKSLQSVALRLLPPVPTHRRVEHFTNPSTWLTSPLPFPVSQEIKTTQS